jgi:hypothetical protein
MLNKKGCLRPDLFKSKKTAALKRKVVSLGKE